VTPATRRHHEQTRAQTDPFNAGDPTIDENSWDKVLSQVYSAFG